jgi:hypothetical protein
VRAPAIRMPDGYACFGQVTQARRTVGDDGRPMVTVTLPLHFVRFGPFDLLLARLIAIYALARCLRRA